MENLKVITIQHRWKLVYKKKINKNALFRQIGILFKLESIVAPTQLTFS